MVKGWMGLGKDRHWIDPHRSEWSVGWSPSTSTNINNNIIKNIIKNIITTLGGRKIRNGTKGQYFLVHRRKGWDGTGQGQDKGGEWASRKGKGKDTDGHRVMESGRQGVKGVLFGVGSKGRGGGGVMRDIFDLSFF